MHVWVRVRPDDYYEGFYRREAQAAWRSPQGRALLTEAFTSSGLTAEQVREFAAGKIAWHKIPRYVHIVEAFPMTVTGKIRKVAMREESIGLLRHQPS